MEQTKRKLSWANKFFIFLASIIIFGFTGLSFCILTFEEAGIYLLTPVMIAMSLYILISPFILLAQILEKNKRQEEDFLMSVNLSGIFFFALLLGIQSFLYSGYEECMQWCLAQGHTSSECSNSLCD